MVVSLISPWNQHLLKLLRKEEMLLRFHGGVEKSFWGVWISCLAPTVLLPALSPDFPAPILCFLLLLSKRTEMLLLLCLLQRHILLMRPSQTLAYSPEKILFQATDM